MPGEPDSKEDLEYGRWLFAQACDFVLGAARPDQLPAGELPEIAFAGRSNVGKSSLINALTGRKTLARAAKSPGRTRQINLFLLGERLMIADLPGYGYARASKAEVAAWTRAVEDYLKGRAALRRVLLLIDARHGIKDADRDAMRLMDAAAVSYQAVLTKTDKVKPGPLAALIEATAKELAGHTAAHPEIAATSAQTGAGIEELRAELARLAGGGEFG